jgi:chitinase
LVNFANAGDNCTAFAGTQLLSCSQIEADIKTCQSQGKTILLSIGGATYTEGGFSSASEAQTWADTLWAMFGPKQSSSSALRPFGAASVDGFDMDFESVTSNMAPFAARLRSHMDSAAASSGRKYFLSGAPQCPFPDAAQREMLEQVPFDFVSVQFYNNYCGATAYPANYNFDTWDNWARTAAPNKNVKILLGVPGGPTGAGSGYVSGDQLKQVIQYSRGFPSFGGVMAWDMSQVYANPGWLDSVVSALGGTVPPVTTTTSKPASTPTTTLVTVTRTSSAGGAPTGSAVPQWGQCGGKGYTGPTQCQAPYTCKYVTEYWSQCA